MNKGNKNIVNIYLCIRKLNIYNEEMVGELIKKVCIIF